MTHSINLIAFGTFGNPNGFKQTFFIGNQSFAKHVKTFDLNTNAIKLFSNSKVYAIRKEQASGFNSVSYSLYTYAKEQNSERSGTFIGSSILYTNKIAKEEITLTQLNEFHNQLINLNVSNDTISVIHSKNFSVVLPKDFDTIESNLREIQNLNFTQFSDKFLLVFCNIKENSLNIFFEKSIDLLNVYDTIYFTDSKEVVEFVHQKGIFKVIQNAGDKREFEREINNLFEERKRKRDNSISEFEKELQRIKDDKNINIQEFQSKLNEYKEIHQENFRKLEDSNRDIHKIAHFYDDFLAKTYVLINQLKNDNRKIDEVKQSHNENKFQFINSLDELKKTPTYITSISKPKAKSNLNASHPQQNSENFSSQKNNIKSNSVASNNINIYKIATLILTLLLFAALVYIIFFKASLELESIQNQEQAQSSEQEKFPIPNKINNQQDLTPPPNAYLTEKEYRILAKKLPYNTRIESIVNIIFDRNPIMIKSNYTGQESVYAKRLLELNKKCFEEKEGSNIFTNDTIRVIPTYIEK